MQRLSRQAVFPLLLSPLFFLAFLHLGCKPTPRSAAEADSGYLLCFWNLENLFDDQFDGRTGPGDKEYDGWVAKHPDILKLKLDKLTEAILKMNNGKGPDILACCEVESVRAAELLQKALNDKMNDANLHYQHVLMKEVSVGRHIAPAIITRLPVIRDKTRSHGRGQRILEAHINVNGKDLVVLASHWTSRLRPEGVNGRAGYGDTLYGVYRAMHTNNPNVDMVICGDFNDTPGDVSVTQHLHATGDLKGVQKNPSPPILLDLMADKSPAAGYGTHYHSGWMIFDHIVVSPGLLDNEGWTCDPATVRTINNLTKPGDRLSRPWRFGGEKEGGPRGYSDHFPVTVRLKVQ
jgi:endonuclease/exonuclease/phosphatase family metal-dependent hydrolase